MDENGPNRTRALGFLEFEEVNPFRPWDEDLALEDWDEHWKMHCRLWVYPT